MSTRHQRLTRAVSGALAASAIAAPLAHARPAEQVQASPTPGAPRTIEYPPEAPAPTVTRTIDEGFDLGSAAVGAGGAAAVLLVAGAGATAVSRRRQRVGVVR
jgi:hypothetical protein